LDDLRSEFGLQDKFMIMERGMPQEELWMLYAASDCFLLTSKAEGLGLPLLEAMSVGVPCIATDCTGMRELLSDGRGTLVHAKDVIRDPFGNGRRYYIDIKKTKDALLQVYETRPDTKAAQEFVRVRTWDDSIQSLNTMLMGLFEEKHEQTA
jgi:glycosyltransferase involved in cell wall biosynthesis